MRIEFIFLIANLTNTIELIFAISQNTNTLKVLLEQGLIESLVQGLVGAAHKGNSMSLYRDIHVLFVTIATKLLELPGSHQIQAILDLHVILDYMEISEKLRCHESSIRTIVRDAQVALFDGELDTLVTKLSNPSGFRLRSTTSYLASASYFTSGNYGVRKSCKKHLHSIFIFKEHFLQFLRRPASRAIMDPIPPAMVASMRARLQHCANPVKEN